LSIYDRVFRTFTPSIEAEGVEYGLADEDRVEAQRLGALLRSPIRSHHD
jgi:hypothetical protein